MLELTGRKLGNYRLLHLIGRGGFADVYLGEHLHLKSFAAVKVLHARLTDELEEDFLKEARILALLSHPHIIRILDFGIEQGIPYLVMEYAPHGTLRQKYPHGSRLPLDVVVNYVHQIADGLQYAHNQKMIHRDLKPENVLIGQHGELLLSDFGVALIVQTTRSHTSKRGEDVAGTASYMAPEQLRGKPQFASDQYALGIMAYEWLCGTKPFTGTFFEIYSQHLTADPPSLLSQVSTLPPPVEQVILKALAKDPDQRFASIKEFADALEQASKGIPILPAIPSPLPLPERESNAPSPLTSQFITQPIGPQIAASTSAPSSLVHTPPMQTAMSQPSSAQDSQEPPVAAAIPPHRKLPTRRTILLASIILLLLLGGNAAAFAVFSSQQAGAGKAQADPQKKSAGMSPPATATSSQRAPGAGQTMPGTTATPVTPTPLPPTATPTRSPNGKLVYSSSLAAQDGAAWAVFTYSGGGGCGFSGGAYHVTMPQKTSVAICEAQGTNVVDFTFQVQMKIIRGDGGGLVFRSNDNGETYRFRVGSDGSYDLVNQVAGVVRGHNRAIKTGMNQTNVLKVTARGDSISLYVNNQLIAQANNGASSSGRVGVFAVDFSNDTEAVFSNARIWQL